MKTKLPLLKLPLVLLLTVAGCSQILGLGDYEIDPSLDEASGGSGTAGKGGGSPGGDAGANDGGSTTLPPQGGQGGVPIVTPEGGAGGEAGGVGNQAGNGQGGIGAGGGPPVGNVVPCDSVACCTALGGVPDGQELLIDGSFELGTVAEGLTPWTEMSTNDIPAITDDTSFGWDPKDGVYFAYLSGLAGERTTVWSEDIVVPADAGWLEISGYRLFQVDSQDAVNADFAGIGFYSYDATDPEELPFFWTTPGAGSDGWGDAPTWTHFSKSWDAAPHQGQTRYLGIRGESDEYSTDPTIDSSSYLFDAISLKAFRCYVP